MASSSILWYVHDVGAGHLQRFRAVAAHLDSPVVVASSLPQLGPRLSGCDAAVAALPSDRSCAERGPGPFHHVPLDHTAADRARALLDVAERHDCTTAVVDVSVETAVLCRLAGLRTVVLRQSGRRDDAPHALAHDCADVVWVPQHRMLEPYLDERPTLRCSGAFSRFDDRRPGHAAARSRLGVDPSRTLVVMLVGQGGCTLDAALWRRHRLPQGVDVVLLGTASRWHHDAVTALGRVDDPFDHLCAADVVISAAGWASVHDIASAGASAALVAEQRPFGEQQVRVEALDAAGLVVALETWPRPEELLQVLARCAALEPGRWDPYYDRKGAQRAAAMIEEVHHGTAP
jgi:hypothetical protein